MRIPGLKPSQLIFVLAVASALFGGYHILVESTKPQPIPDVQMHYSDVREGWIE